MTITESDRWLVLYRGEYSGNRGGKFYSLDKEFARQFTQSGLDREIRTIRMRRSAIYQPSTPIYAGDPDAVDVGIAQAKTQGFAAIQLDEGPGEPNSVYIF